MEYIFNQESLSFAENASMGCYVHEISNVTFSLRNNRKYLVVWDGSVYTCKSYIIEETLVAIGNTAIIGNEDTGEPFGIAFSEAAYDVYFYTTTAESSHTVSIIPLFTDEYFPETVMSDNGYVEGYFASFIHRPWVSLDLKVGERYEVVYDNTLYSLIAKEIVINGIDTVFVGNSSLVKAYMPDIENTENTGEPFFIADMDGDMNVFAEAADTHTVGIYQEIKDIILPEQELSFLQDTETDTYLMSCSMHVCEFNTSDSNDILEVIWDGETYVCEGTYQEDTVSIGYIYGNRSIIDPTAEDTGEPFCLMYALEHSESVVLILTNSTESTHTVAVYRPTETGLIYPETTLEGFVDGINEYEKSGFILIPDKTYRVTVDDVEYECIPRVVEQESGDAKAIESDIFTITSLNDILTFNHTDTTATSHTLSIKIIDNTEGDEIPDTQETIGANILLYDRNGAKQTYESVDKIVVDTPGGTKGATFTYGEALENAEYEPNFANGDYTVSLEKGQLLKGFAIKKPETLLPENIIKGIDIAGVVGTNENDIILENMEIELSLADGDQTLNAGDGYAIKTATIKKPETLIPENIVKDINIAGVVGSHEEDIVLENMEIELSLANGDQTLDAGDGHVIKSATIKKPETLISSNIRKNVDIAGVTGTLMYIEEIETEEEMNALLVSSNVGNAYRFVGETTENYINGDIYVVEESV